VCGARDRLATALARVRAISPPPEARRLHAGVLRLLTLQQAAAAELLLWDKAGCGSCHRLTAAGSTGTSGPNLDPLQRAPAEIAAKVRAGGGMPAFAKRIAPKNIDQLAAFVSAAEARQAANTATLDAYATAFEHYGDAAAGVLASLRRLEAPPVLEPSRQAELRIVGRAAGLSGAVATALRKRDVPDRERGDQEAVRLGRRSPAGKATGRPQRPPYGPTTAA
jgi:cytochrome c553